jgi:hypothetical protein
VLLVSWCILAVCVVSLFITNNRLIGSTRSLLKTNEMQQRILSSYSENFDKAYEYLDKAQKDRTFVECLIHQHTIWLHATMYPHAPRTTSDLEVDMVRPVVLEPLVAQESEPLLGVGIPAEPDVLDLGAANEGLEEPVEEVGEGVGPSPGTAGA